MALGLVHGILSEFVRRGGRIPWGLPMTAIWSSLSRPRNGMPLKGGIVLVGGSCAGGPDPRV